jgi:hypothetical protein
MDHLHAAIAEMRAVIARAGEQDRLNWWPSTLYSRGSATLTRLFPHTHASAAYGIVSHAIRQSDGTADPRNGVLSLFFLGGRREALIAQEEARPPQALLEAQVDDGEALAELILGHYAPHLGQGYLEKAASFEVNTAQNRIDVGTVARTAMSEERLKNAVGLLVAGLRFSTPNTYIPPVLRLTGEA